MEKWYVRGWKGDDYMPFERFADSRAAAAAAVAELLAMGCDSCDMEKVA